MYEKIEKQIKKQKGVDLLRITLFPDEEVTTRFAFNDILLKDPAKMGEYCGELFLSVTQEITERLVEDHGYSPKSIEVFIAYASVVFTSTTR